MVSLIDKVGYFCTVSDKLKITSFNSFLRGEKINIDVLQDASETEKIYYKLLTSFLNENENEFKNAHSEIARRKPATDNAWIHDNFLIFILVCGIGKFHIDKSWINQVLQVRVNANSEYQSINQTFKNILNGNYQSTDNLFEIVIVFLDLLNKPQLPKVILDKVYLSISNTTQLFDSKNDFLVTVSCRAFDINVVTHETPDAIEAVNLKTFKGIFLKRIRIARNIIYFLVLISFILLSLQYLRGYKDFRDYATDIGTIFQIMGVAFFAMIKWMRKKCEWLLLYLFGYYKSFK